MDAVAGDGPLGDGLFLAVVQEAQQPRWFVPPFHYGNRAQLAVDSSGEMVLATPVPGENNRVALDKYNLSGELLWHRQMSDLNHGTRSGSSVEFSAANSPNHHTLVSSSWFTARGAFDVDERDSVVVLLVLPP